jgi:hypothetical protein
MIREKLRGFSANVWNLTGNQIIFQLENVWTDSTSSWTGGAFQSTMDPRTERGRSSSELSPCSATGTKAHHGGAGRERATAAERIGVRRRCSLWSKRRHGEVKQGAARVVVWCRDAIRVFYSLGEEVEGRGGGRSAVDF